MAVTMADVVRSLIPDEADLNQAAAALGPEALPHLGLLVRGPDPLLASKATYVAGQIIDPGTIRVLEIAAARADRQIRVTAATMIGTLPPKQAGNLLMKLLIDSDPEIRRLAIEAVPAEAIRSVHNVLEMLALTDPYPFLRDLSGGVLRSLDKNEASNQKGDDSSV
jgi:HEAT repeat protein